MKRLYWIFAFLIVVVAGDRAGGYLLDQLVRKSQFRYSRLYAESAEADILLVGNSRGLMFYQPYLEEITEKSTFNLSYNGMPMNLAKALVEDYLERYDPPELMLLDVTICDRKNEELIASFSPYLPLSERIEKLIFDADSRNGYANHVTHIYRYNSEIFQRAMFYLNTTDEGWLLDRVISQSMINGIDKEEDYYMDIPDAMLQALQETIALAESKGVEVRLVINPYYPPFARKIYNLDEVIAKMEEATQIKVHNYALAIMETEGFGDYQHLNKEGSKQFLDLLKVDNLLSTDDQSSHFLSVEE